MFYTHTKKQQQKETLVIMNKLSTKLKGMQLSDLHNLYQFLDFTI